jgi:hypothetical protein
LPDDGAAETAILDRLGRRKEITSWACSVRILPQS